MLISPSSFLRETSRLQTNRPYLELGGGSLEEFKIKLDHDEGNLAEYW